MNKNKKMFLGLFFLLFFSSIFSFVPETYAVGLQYTLLEKIPGFDSTNGDLPGYITAVYNVALAVVVLSAVLMVSIGGFMYLTSAGNTATMGTAKGIIFDAIIGLVLALSAWVLLNTINSDLTNVSMNGLSATPGETLTVPATPTGPAPTPGSGSGCGGYAVSGINSNQCNDASQALSDLLKCMYDKNPNTKVNSISDSAGFARCKNQWSSNICAHAKTSCHYGGGSGHPECTQSLAADLSTTGVSAQAIIDAASACGGRVNNEGNHIHVSVPSSCCTL